MLHTRVLICGRVKASTGLLDIAVVDVPGLMLTVTRVKTIIADELDNDIASSMPAFMIPVMGFDGAMVAA